MERAFAQAEEDEGRRLRRDDAALRAMLGDLPPTRDPMPALAAERLGVSLSTLNRRLRRVEPGSED
jgi:hypothetical protein